MFGPERYANGAFSVSADRRLYPTNRQPVEPLDDPRFDETADLVATLARRGSSRTPRVGLTSIAALRYHVERLELFAVTNARSLGWSWQDIGDALGLSKQSLHRRYARRFPRPKRLRRRQINTSPYARRRTRQ